MNDALYIAATGMQTQQLAVDTIANNMANANTPGYKSGRVNFQELMYRDAVTHTGSDAAASLQSPLSTPAQGSGVGVASLLKSFAPGTLTATTNPLDLAIKGDGFIEVQQADGSTAYWRGGTLRVTSDGWLATSTGQLVKPQIRVDKDVTALVIDSDGKVSTHQAGAKPVQLGQLTLHVFANESGLKPLGDALYQPTDGSGDATTVRPIEAGAGIFVQNASEASNVVLVDEMVNLMMAQRAYEMNLKVIQTADDMLAMSNNLRK
jgi:flagellar basal-body rod protein FlgG